MSKKTHVAYLLTKGSITLSYNGLSKSVAKEDQRFPKILDAIRDGKMDLIPEIVDPTLQFQKAGIEAEEGLLKIKGLVMPPELNARIMEYKSQKLPFQSLLNFWSNLEQNPSFNCRKELFKFLDNKGHSITEDGCFIGYRGVRDDFKDKHSNTFDNSPGQVCKMPRHLVDDKAENSCSHGLHVGGFDYAKQFGAGGKLVIVKVNPKDVVAVPDAYNGNKLRVCEFEVLSETAAALVDTVVSKKGTKMETLVDTETSELDPARTSPPPRSLKEVAKQFSSAYATTKNDSSNAAHKAQYANNHAKRGPDGKFIAKKKTGSKRRSR